MELNLINNQLTDSKTENIGLNPRGNLVSILIVLYVKEPASSHGINTHITSKFLFNSVLG